MREREKKKKEKKKKKKKKKKETLKRGPSLYQTLKKVLISETL